MMYTFMFESVSAGQVARIAIEIQVSLTILVALSNVQNTVRE